MKSETFLFLKEQSSRTCSSFRNISDSLGRIHKNEGYPCKHKVEVQGNGLKQKLEV